MIIRKHVIVYLRLLFFFFLIAVIPVMFFVYFWSKRFSFFEGGLAAVSGYLGVCIYLLYSIAILLIAWLNEEFDLFILTNTRLVDMTQVSFFKRKVAMLPLAQIQDTTSEISGLIGTILDYGDVNFKTAAGDSSEFFMDHVPDPSMVARKILNVAREARGQAPVSDEKNHPQNESDMSQA